MFAADSASEHRAHTATPRSDLGESGRDESATGDACSGSPALSVPARAEFHSTAFWQSVADDDARRSFSAADDDDDVAHRECPTAADDDDAWRRPYGTMGRKQWCPMAR